MISCQLEPLNSEQEQKLRAWLVRPEFDTLLRVSESKVKALQVEALALSLEGANYEAKLDAANAKLVAAQRAQLFVDSLTALKSPEAKFQIAKVS